MQYRIRYYLTTSISLLITLSTSLNFACKASTETQFNDCQRQLSLDS
jgi:hypothetical protein